MKYKWKNLSERKPKKTGLYYVEFTETYPNGSPVTSVYVAKYYAKEGQFKTAFYDEKFIGEILRWAKK